MGTDMIVKGIRNPRRATDLHCTECVEEKNAKQDDGTTRANACRHFRRRTGPEQHVLNKDTGTAFTERYVHGHLPAEAEKGGADFWQDRPICLADRLF